MTGYGNNTFQYGADGIRCRKNNVHYTLDGNRILQEYHEDTEETLTFYYGEKGVFGFRHRDANGAENDYFYRKNLFGDVVAIYNANGQRIANYRYDAWGYHIPGNDDNENLAIKNINPFRYRSYYYDTETCLYYLESRYYDPELCRFLNPDTIDYLGDGEEMHNYNLFAYCGNNPVMYSDPQGHKSIPWWGKLLLGVGFLVAGAAVASATVATGGAATFASTLIAGIKTAAISGAIAAGTSASITALVSIASGDDATTTLRRTASAIVDGFADGFMWGGIVFGTSRALGYLTSKTGIFNRNVTYGKNNFLYGTNELTLWRHGSNFRIDTNATIGLHYHLRTATVGIGKHRIKWIQEMIGILSGMFSIE